MTRPRSLTFRVLAVSSVWLVIALLVVAILIGTLYRQASERNFRELLRAQLYNVINSVSLDEQGRLTGTPELGDLRFVQPFSGWYWAVDLLDESGQTLSSVSLGAADVPVPPASLVPFDLRYERFYSTEDPHGGEVLVAETEVLLGDSGKAARFRVMGDLSAVESDIAAFTRRLFLYFGVFALGSLAINAIAILYSLRPLDAVRRSLERVRNGETAALQEPFPVEIEPLAREANALIESNRRVVERARMQVGNLAHSLKTPLAVLRNESGAMSEGQARLVRTQVESMQAQVQIYLDRARIAAQKGTVLARVEARPVLERLVRVMGRLNPDVRFELAPGGEPLTLPVEQQDLEEVAGNLMENAGKFARTRVLVSLERLSDGEAAGGKGKGGGLALSIDDDGPGLSQDQMHEAVKRGRRLDESKPGSGLGLSIVSEIAREYDGELRLSRSRLGGLRATVIFPAH